MALYRYVKDQQRERIKLPKTLSFLCIVSGIGILVWTLWPIVSFATFSERLFTQTVSPMVDSSKTTLSSLTFVGGRQEKKTLDYSNANIWFPSKPQKKVATPINSYTLSIPKLNIKDALVLIGSDDLGVSLIHYGGTPLPGQYGNAVIFGHSTLPQFFNPTNYKTIFSTLPTLSKGDTIVVAVDGIAYKFTVYDIVVVEPTDLSPLEQKFDDSYMTLVTCVPPGTYWKRLNVKAKLDINL